MTSSPRGVQAAGKRLWKAVTSDYDLDPPERELLVSSGRKVRR